MVYYYVPEDMDDLAMPNAFAIPKNVSDITLADIESLFPLEGGGEAYHFRFKYKYNGQSVWLDLSNKACKVPKVENRIIMKVTRKQPKNGRNISRISNIKCSFCCGIGRGAFTEKLGTCNVGKEWRSKLDLLCGRKYRGVLWERTS